MVPTKHPRGQCLCRQRVQAGDVCLPSYISTYISVHSRVWSLERSAPPLTLPHPCYVYAVQFATSAAIVCTAAYDGCLRVWRLQDDSVGLVAELREHRGLVNCLAWDMNRSLLYSCDSDGGMCVWTVKDNAVLQRKVKVMEVSG